MNTALWILLVIIALFAGAVGGIFIARRQFTKEVILKVEHIGIPAMAQ